MFEDIIINVFYFDRFLWHHLCKQLLDGQIMEIDTKTTIIFLLLGVIFGMIGRLQGWF